MKQGKIFIPVLVVFAIIILTVSYVKLSTHLTQFYDLDVGRDLGKKQGAVMAAVREGERVQLYVQDAAHIALQLASRSEVCGEPYIGLTVIGKQRCELQATDIATEFRKYFNQKLAEYPPGTLTDISWEATTSESNGAVTTTLAGKKRIPVGDVTIVHQSQGSYSGASTGGLLDSWPTTDLRVTSYFGNRNIEVPGASKNHPGLDIGAYGQSGTEVKSVADGMARYYPKGPNSFIEITSEQFIIEYVHVQANANIPSDRSVPVREGEVIGRTIKPTGTPHVHMQISLPDINKKTVTSYQSWLGHYSDSTQNTPGMKKSYAAFRPSGRVYLDPVCFYNKTFIEPILTRTNDNDRTNDVTLPANFFEPCAAYEQQLKLSDKFKLPELATPPLDEESPETRLQPNSTNWKVTRTQQNVQKYSLMPTIVAAAEREDIPPELILAVITQETQGEPMAISPTGPAGISQFSADTAKSYFEKDDRALITACCTATQSGDLCKNPARNMCDESSDPRFNPHKSITAQAKFLRDLLAAYKDYEHGVAFAIASYNGGSCPVNQAIAQTGKDKQATWQEVESILRSMPDTILCGESKKPTPIRKNEIADYGNLVLSFYEAWGGKTIAVSPYSSAQTGYYDIALNINAPVSTTLAKAVIEINNAITQCETSACVEQVLARGANGVTIHKEELSGEGCMPVAERLQAHVANQFNRCLATPQLACGCPLTSPTEITLTVTPHATRLTRINSEAVENIDAVSGPAYPGEGESANAEEIQRYVENQVRNIGESVTAKISPSGTELNPGITGTSVLELYRTEQGVAFSSQETLDCVLPQLPVPYCVKDAQNPEQRLVVYIDPTPHSKPIATITDIVAVPSVVPAQPTSVSFSSMQEFALVHVIVQPRNIGVYVEHPDAKHYYLPVRDPMTSLFFNAQGPGVEKVLNKYLFFIDSSISESVYIRLVDENLRETDPIVVVP